MGDFHVFSFRDGWMLEWHFASFQLVSFQLYFIPCMRVESGHLCDYHLATECSASQKFVLNKDSTRRKKMATIFYGFSHEETKFICPSFGSWVSHMTCQWDFSKHDANRRLRSASVLGLPFPAPSRSPTAAMRTSTWGQAQPSRTWSQTREGHSRLAKLLPSWPRPEDFSADQKNHEKF